ncbi:MAG: tyrosine-type recombinase/integrase, partial [Gammaproteobacteria bacterium]|nr:tyrosine-type recombinase/integrase [Gammaproteobacteria bacterium]
PVSATVVETFWRRVRAEAGIADVRLHDCRHTYASIAIMAGESVTTTARLLGHNDAQTTLKYAHLSDRSVREATDSLATILGEEG